MIDNGSSRELGYIDWINAFHKLKAEQGGSK